MKTTNLLLLTFMLFSCSEEKATKYFDSGDKYRVSGDYSSAIQEYSKAIEINNQFAEAYVNRGYSKEHLKDYVEAILDFNNAIEINPSLSIAYLYRSNAKVELKDYDGALKDVNKALGLQPNSSDGYNLRGSIYHEMGDYNSALDDYNEAILLNQSHGMAFYNRGLIKNKQGFIEEARIDWSKAGELGIKEAYDRIAENRNLRNRVSEFECINCDLIQFRNPGYMRYGLSEDSPKILSEISIINNTGIKLREITIRYKCLDENGNDYDSGEYRFGGNSWALMEANSTKRVECYIKFPAQGRLIFEIKSYDKAFY